MNFLHELIAKKRQSQPAESEAVSLENSYCSDSIGQAEAGVREPAHACTNEECTKSEGLTADDPLQTPSFHETPTYPLEQAETSSSLSGDQRYEIETEPESTPLILEAEQIFEEEDEENSCEDPEGPGDTGCEDNAHSRVTGKTPRPSGVIETAYEAKAAMLGVPSGESPLDHSDLDMAADLPRGSGLERYTGPIIREVSRSRQHIMKDCPTSAEFAGGSHDRQDMTDRERQMTRDEVKDAARAQLREMQATRMPVSFTSDDFPEEDGRKFSEGGKDGLDTEIDMNGPCNKSPCAGEDYSHEKVRIWDLEPKIASDVWDDDTIVPDWGKSTPDQQGERQRQAQTAAASQPKGIGRTRTRLIGFHRPLDDNEDPLIRAKGGSSRNSAGGFPVGWLVVEAGPGRGAGFSLQPGVSTIGRGSDQAVQLDLGDSSISRDNHAAIAYDEEENKFYIGHGGKANLVRLNGAPVLSTVELKSFDQIRIGETTLRFVELCGINFSWSNDDIDV